MNKDLVTEKDYQKSCTKLLRQLYNQKKAIENQDDSFKGIQDFLDQYGYECGHARRRMEVGIAEDFTGSGGGGSKSVYAFELAQYFLTAKDALELDMKEVDQLLPLISDIVQGINRIDIPRTDPAFKAKDKILEWHTTLHKMKAVDFLNEGQIRQLKLDLETTQSAMYVFLGASKKGAS